MALIQQMGEQALAGVVADKLGVDRQTARQALRIALPLALCGRGIREHPERGVHDDLRHARQQRVDHLTEDSESCRDADRLVDDRLDHEIRERYYLDEGTYLQHATKINAGEPIEEDGDLFGSSVITAARIVGLPTPVAVAVQLRTL